MKANRSQIEKALDAPPPHVRLFLLSGTDEAGSAALAKRLVRAMGPEAERIDLDPQTLKNDPARLADEAAALSMFGDRRWIRILQAGEEILPAIEALMDVPQAGNPVVAMAGALKGSSKLLKAAQDSDMAMSFISYALDAREADQIAVAIAREAGLRLSPELARKIAEMASNDRTLMANEIEKLSLYLDAAPDRPGEVTQDVIAALSAETPEEDAGALVNAVLTGDLPAMRQELTNLSALGASLGSVLRPLQIRAMLIAQIRAEFDRSGRIDDAVKTAGRAVFWKEERTVQRQVRLWDASGIARVIQRLGAAERASRSSRNAGDVVVAAELLTIARQAARGRD